MFLRSGFSGGFSRQKELKPKDTVSSRWDEDGDKTDNYDETEDDEDPGDMLDTVILDALRYKNSVKAKLRSWAEKAKLILCLNNYLLLIPKVSKFCGNPNGPIVDH